MKTSKLLLFTTNSVNYLDFTGTSSPTTRQFLPTRKPALRIDNNRFPVRSIGLASLTGFSSGPFRAMILASLLLLSQFRPVTAQNPLARAAKFNLFLAGDATLSTNESDGAIAVGGNLTVAGNYQVAVKGSAASFQVGDYPIGLVVGGGVKLQAGSLKVNSNTFAKIGACAGNSATDALKVWYKDNNNTYSTIRITRTTAGYSDEPNVLFNANANATIESSSLICHQGNFSADVVNFTSSFATLKTNSSQLAQKASRVNLTNEQGQSIDGVNPPNKVFISLNTGVNVWNVTGSDLNKIQLLTFSNAPSSDRVLIINVNAAGSFTWTTPNLAGVSGNNAPYMLWNFYNTTQLNIGGSSTIEGSLLAPLADITKTTNQSNIEGQVVANSFIQSGGELHDFPFNAEVEILQPVSVSGNVFNDVNGMTDGIVNGTAVSSLLSNTFYVSLVNTSGTVVASTSLTSGSFSFTGITPNSSYSVVLSNTKGVVGSAPPSTTLTDGVVNTGEYIGTGTGSDGTPDGVILVTVGTSNVSDVNCGIKACPDLTPIIYARPSTIYGRTNVTVVVDVVELLGTPTNGLVTVKVTKDSKLILTFPSNETVINGKSVQNGLWTYDDTKPGYYVLTTTSVVPAGDKLSFGFTGVLTPGATTGVLTASSVIMGGSGGEVRTNNNVDADKIDYFQQ